MSVFSIRNKENKSLYEIEIFKTKNTEFEKLELKEIIQIVPTPCFTELFLFLTSLNVDYQCKFIKDFEEISKYNNFWFVYNSRELKKIPYDFNFLKDFIKKDFYKFCENYNLILNED